MFDRHLRVLLVEDNPGDQRLVAEALRHERRLTLETASTLTDAMERLAGAPAVDIAVLDLGLPDSRGLETFRRIHDALPSLPVIVLTGDHDDDRAVEAVSEGAQDFLVKSETDFASLGRAIRYAVERQLLNQQLSTNLRHREGLLALGQLSLEGADEQTILAAAVKIVVETLGVDHAVVAQVTDESLTVRASHGWPGVDGSLLPLDRAALAARVYGQDRPVVVRDIARSEEVHDTALIEMGVASAVAVPIPNGSRPWGILGACTDRPHQFSTQETEFLVGAARALAGAQRRQKAEAAVEERLKELRGLTTIQRATLDRDSSLDSLGPLVVKEVLRSVEDVSELGVELEVDGRRWTHGSVGGPTGGNTLRASVAVAGVCRGHLRICHEAGRPFLLPYEQTLIEGVAESVGLWLERHETARDLADRQRELNFLVSQIPGTLWTTDRDLRYTLSVGSGLERLGVAPNEVVGLSVEDALGPEATRALDAHHRALDGEGVTYAFSHHDNWQAYVEPLRDHRGDITGVIGVALDLTEQRQAEAALEQSQSRLQFIMDQLPGIVWTTDRDLVVRSHSGRAHKALDVEPNAFVGRSGVDFLGEDSVGVAAARRALQGESSLVEEEVLGRTWETYIAPIRSDDEKITGTIGLALDITEMTEARRELEESRLRLQGLFDNALDAMLLTDDAGRYIDANPAAQKMLGYPREKLLGMRIQDISGDLAVGDVDAAWSGFLAAGMQEGEFPLRRSDGTVILTEFRAVANIIPGVHLSAMRNVTDQREAAARLRESEERFRRLAENAQDVIFRVAFDPSPHFEYVSPAITKMLGYTPQDLYDDPDLAIRLVHPDDRAVHNPRLERRDEHPGMTVRWRRRDGNYIWVDERHAYIYDDDGVLVASEGVVRDITDRVQIEEALRGALEREREAAEHLRELDSLKNAFLTAVSHEVRTPLTSITGFAQVLRDRGDVLVPELRTQLADRVVANSRRLSRLLMDMLDVDRLAQGAGAASRTTADIGMTIRRMVEEVPHDDHPVTVVGDEGSASIDVPRFERMVEHLVHNAVHHTPRGTQVWVRWTIGDGMLLLHVDDAGPGVPDHLKQEIFAAFRHGASEAAKVGGAGMGLAMVQRYAEIHGGRAWVEDRPGGGASFCVEIPTNPDAPLATETTARASHGS